MAAAWRVKRAEERVGTAENGETRDLRPVTWSLQIRRGLIIYTYTHNSFDDAQCLIPSWNSSSSQRAGSNVVY